VGGAQKEGTEETRLTLCWYSKPHPLRSSLTPLRQAVLRYPFEVALPEGLLMLGVMLADHAKSADWSARRAKFVAKAPTAVVAEVTAKLKQLLRV
jgi:mRNA-degrading endonuclease toxin of MazEF toxin-antitoxin module